MREFAISYLAGGPTATESSLGFTFTSFILLHFRHVTSSVWDYEQGWQPNEETEVQAATSTTFPPSEVEFPILSNQSCLPDLTREKFSSFWNFSLSWAWYLILPNLKTSNIQQKIRNSNPKPNSFYTKVFKQTRINGLKKPLQICGISSHRQVKQCRIQWVVHHGEKKIGKALQRKRRWKREL